MVTASSPAKDHQAAPPVFACVGSFRLSHETTRGTFNSCSYGFPVLSAIFIVTRPTDTITSFLA